METSITVKYVYSFKKLEILCLIYQHLIGEEPSGGSVMKLFDTWTDDKLPVYYAPCMNINRF